MVRAAREWVSFDDPEEDGRRWQIDVTFLLSHWRCIFGDGCQGVLDEQRARADPGLLLVRRPLHRQEGPRRGGEDGAGAR